jgi:hypothetical protein
LSVASMVSGATSSSAVSAMANSLKNLSVFASI